MQIRTITRRRVAVALASLIAAVAAPAALMAGRTVPAPQHDYYYTDGSYSTLVGEGEWGCDLKYRQWWGTTSSYKVVVPIDCSAPQF